MPQMGDNQAQLATIVDADVLEIVRRLSKAEGVSHGELIGRLVRAYDETPPPVECELEDDASMSVYVPRDRDMLAAAFVAIVDAAKPIMHENHILSAMGLARTHLIKGLPEYQDAEKWRKRWQEIRDNGARPLTYSPPLKSSNTNGSR